MRERPVTCGLLGCGTVGGGVVRLLTRDPAKVTRRVGVPIEIRRVLVRDLGKARVPELDGRLLTTDASEVLDDPDIEMVIEVMGGAEPTLDHLMRAIDAKKGVVTANKLLLATAGKQLLERAQAAGVDLAFEGAVGGGVPIVRTLREALASDRVESITGIVNGTSNYVLTRMLDAGLSLDDAVAEAQARGYAEADPTMDVGGGDAAQKLSILAMLGFGAAADYADLHVEGIQAIAPIDHRFAERFAYRIKHLAIGRDHGDEVELRVHPCLLPQRSVLANVDGVLNAVTLTGEALGPCLVSGQGAGDLPTAVSVVSDALDVARSLVAGVAGLQTRAIAYEARPLRAMAAIETRYYIRFTVLDEPGVIAAIAGRLGDAGVSIEQLVQDGPRPEPGEPATVVMLTHRAREGAVQAALGALREATFMVEPARLLRIEEP
ncbi:MAG: homoserine dehydrogenase [Polyangiaceae bacterium]